jgi:hypothetical protein
VNAYVCVCVGRVVIFGRKSGITRRILVWDDFFFKSPVTVDSI